MHTADAMFRGGRWGCMFEQSSAVTGQSKPLILPEVGAFGPLAAVVGFRIRTRSSATKAIAFWPSMFVIVMRAQLETNKGCSCYLR